MATRQQTEQQIQVMSKLAAKFMMAYFSSTTATENYPVPSQDAIRRDLAAFIAEALRRANLSGWMLYAALFLLEKYAALDHDPRRRNPSIYALFITAYKLATHSLIDDSYSGKGWRQIAQDRFNDVQMGEFGRDFCKVLDWRFKIPMEELQPFSTRVIEQYGQ